MVVVLPPPLTPATRMTNGFFVPSDREWFFDRLQHWAISCVGSRDVVVTDLGAVASFADGLRQFRGRAVPMSALISASSAAPRCAHPASSS